MSTLRFTPLVVLLVASACGSSTISPTSAPGPAGSGASPGQASATIAVAGAGTRPATACGSQKTFTVVRGAAPISVSGAIIPAPPVGTIVRVKAKLCVGSLWQTANEQHFKVTGGGRFTGFVPTPGRGSYTIRAYFDTGATTIRSAKSYVVVQ